jgi:phosphoribosylformimino-5-aminoimidazole carboxamide ribotide isomerase
MHIIPAVDIKQGQAVRLFQGEKDRETVYSDSPLDMARRWVDAGATYLHVVDLDGAFDGVSENEEHIARIAQELTIPVEVGGGIRTIAKAQRIISYGVERVIVGTKALESREFLYDLLTVLPGKVNVGIDARDGMVAVKGWTETSGTKAEDFLRELAGSGVAAIIYTDISRDGAMQGANIGAMKKATEVTDVPIIASGGVSTLEDVKKLAKLPLFGMIVGKALYEKAFTLQEAMAALTE